MRKHQYRQVICEVCDCHHRTAEDVFLAVQKKYPQVGKATIYRNLESLSELWEIRKIPGLNGKTYYECNREPHAHLVNDIQESCQDFSMENIEVKNIPEGYSISEICIHITPKSH